MNIKMSRKLKRDMRHFSAYKALDETINSHRKLESSIIRSTSEKIIVTITQQQSASKQPGWRVKPARIPRGNSIPHRILFLVTSD